MLSLMLLVFVWLQQPALITLDGPPVDIAYTVSEPVRLSVRAQAEIDVTLAVLRGNNLLAYNDDEGDGTDAAIHDLVLTEPGDYTIRLHTFNGVEQGEVMLSIETLPLVAPCDVPLQTVTLAAQQPFACTLMLDAGAHLTLTARDTAGTADPVLTLSAGDFSLSNDDHASLDTALNTLDAQLVATLDEGGVYTVTVTDFAGQSGRVALEIDISS